MRFAKQVPEARSRLLRFYEQHAADVWRPMSLGTADHPVPPVVAAAPQQDRSDRLAEWTADVLRTATLFWASQDMTELACHAAQSLPTFAMHREVLPAPHGLLCWAAPVVSRSRPRYGRIDTVAAMWSAQDDGVWIELLDDARPFAGIYGPGALGWLAPGEGLLVPWAEQIELTSTGGEDNPNRDAVYALVATWLLMGQTLTASSQETPRPVDARRITRRDHPVGEVTCVALRKTEYARGDGNRGQDAGQDAGKRSYHHQWIVTDHWRNQYYPSIDAHRPIWISPHLKGPEGAPLLHAEKVYTLRK